MRKPSVPPSTIATALAAALGEPVALTPLTEGEESQAFRFAVGAHDYVVRINRTAAGFEKDAFAARRFASVDLPIPEVFHIGWLDDESAYCVTRRLPGVTLQDLAPAELPPLLAPTARVMRAIAASDLADTAGFGPFNAHGVGRFATWRGFLISIADGDDYDWDAGRLVNLGCIARFRQQVADLTAHCPEERRLVHGDFGSNNVLTDGCRITGVIDWAEAMFGDPLYDVANVFFWRTWLDCMAQQARYFERTLDHQPHLHERLRCYQLRIGLDQVDQAAIAGDAKTVAWALARCDEIDREDDR